MGNPKITMRLTATDAANLARLAAALRTSLGRPFLNRVEALRYALATAADAVEAGQVNQ